MVARDFCHGDDPLRGIWAGWRSPWRRSASLVWCGTSVTGRYREIGIRMALGERRETS